MAHILIATLPATGHFNPVAPIARELVNRGHTVWWYTGKIFQGNIEHIGATYKPMYAAYDFSGMNRKDSFPQLEGLQGLSAFIGGWKHIFIEQAPKQMEDILRLLEEFSADVLIADETCFGMGFVHEKTGIPLVNVATSIYFFSSKDTAPLGLALPPDSSPLGQVRNAVLRFFLDNIALRELRTYTNETRTRLGLPKLNRSVLESVTPPPNLYLLGTVPSFEYPRSDTYEHTHFVGALINSPPQQFNPPVWWDDLHGDRPVVLVTQGTVANDDLNELIFPTIRALAQEDVLVVATTANIPVETIKLDLPNNVRLEQFIPHSYLMPYVDIMVANGGYGSVQTALSNGVPIIVSGITEEKSEVAARVAWAGVGINLKTQTPSEAQIRDAIRTILHNPSYKHNVQQLQAEYERYNGPQRSADLIELLVKTKQSLGVHESVKALES